MNPYLAALKAALLAGHYVPELEIVFIREDDFREPRALALDLGV